MNNPLLPKLSEYHTEQGQNEDLFQAYQQIAEGSEYQKLAPAQRKVIDNTLRNFRLAGIGLPEEKKQRFKAIMQELSTLGSRFQDNVMDATQAWTKHINDESELSGLPDSAKAMARQAAQQKELDGWLLTLEFPSYFAVITYADNGALREEMYRAYNTRASDQFQASDKNLDNAPVMAQILKLRHEAAQILGFANFAEYSLATKMAETPQQVLDFLYDLAKRAKPQAERDLQEVHEFVAAQFGVDELQAWDIPYYSEKLRQHRYQISQEELRPYFPENKVISGLFAVVERLYGLQICPTNQFETWHPDVKCYEIVSQDGQLRGRFFFDLYARSNKRGGAWMDGCVTRRKLTDHLQIPAAYMVCNFSPPVRNKSDGKPALFTHDEVLTLFHEFGHGLHHLLTRIDYAAVAGINGVEWDAVELPSQFMENWCWEREALDLISGHIDSGEPIPEDLYQRMLAAKNFQSAMQMVRQLEFSVFDFRLHAEYDPNQGARVQGILDEVRAQVAVLKPPSWNRFANSFLHIFAGGYAAGYYSYKWAEVLSADAFSKFEENGIFDQTTGQQFLAEVLEVGGSRDAIDNFKAFRGREPKVDALLRHSGIAA